MPEGVSGLLSADRGLSSDKRRDISSFAKDENGGWTQMCFLIYKMGIIVRASGVGIGI